MSTVTWIIVLVAAVGGVIIVVSLIGRAVDQAMASGKRAIDRGKVVSRATLTAFATGGASLLFPSASPSTEREVAPEFGARSRGGPPDKAKPSRADAILRALASGGASLIFTEAEPETKRRSEPLA